MYKTIKKDTKKEYALKIIPKKKIQGIQSNRLAAEIDIHKMLKNIRVVKLYHYFDDDENIYLFLELCKISLHAQLQGLHKFSMDVCRTLFKEIMEGIDYLRSVMVMHRDLKLANILLTHDDHIKIADFGTATRLKNIQEEHNTYCGTPNYIPPEIANRQPYTIQADLWSIGVILFTMVTGKPPFEGENPEDTMRKGSKCNIPWPEIGLEENCCDLIKKLLQRDPNKRLSIKDIFAHPFLSSNILPKSPFSKPIIIQMNEEERSQIASPHFVQKNSYLIKVVHQE